VSEFVSEAWCPVAASARDQAVDLTFRLARGFVERSGFAEAYDIHPGYRSIAHRGSGGVLKIFASSAASGDGVDPTLAMIEELHRLDSMELYETWAGKLDKSHGQLVIVSTAGEPGSPFEDLRTRFRQGDVKVDRDRCFVRSESVGSVIHDYALPDDGDPEDLELVAAANPFSGKTVESLARHRAKKSWNLPHWRRFTCNLPTRDVSAAISETEWYAAVTDEEIPVGETVAVGLDLGFRADTTCLVPLWVQDREHRQLGPAVELVPPKDRQLDQREIESAFLRMHERNPIGMVVMDPYHGDLLSQWLEIELGCEVVERKQTLTLMALDYSRFMEALREGWLTHAGDEAMTRHALNAVAKVLPRGDTIFERPAKSKPGTDNSLRVVDALDAAAMVHSTLVAQWDEVVPEAFFEFA
jgi:phage terminase large subunit-like protein